MNNCLISQLKAFLVPADQCFTARQDDTLKQEVLEMNKEKYIAPEMEIVEFEGEDIITVSNELQPQ